MTFASCTHQSMLVKPTLELSPHSQYNTNEDCFSSSHHPTHQGVAGPSFKLVHVHPLVRLSWRGQASVCFVLPLACWMLRQGEAYDTPTTSVLRVLDPRHVA